MDESRFFLLKQAAKQVVRTLTVGDRVAIVDFSTAASVFARDGRFLFTATSDNIALILEYIESMEAIGLTNFLDAFNKTFTVLDDTVGQELHTPCNTAILKLITSK